MNNDKRHYGPSLRDMKREDDESPYLHGLTYGLYKAGTDYLLCEEFGGRKVTNRDGRYTEDEVKAAAEIIRRAEG